MFGLFSKKQTIKIQGMHCSNCEKNVANALKQIPNVKEAQANFKEGTANVRYSGQLDMNDIRQKVAAVGYEVAEN